LLSGGLSYLLGANVHSQRAVKKIKTKFQKEQKALYAQYYNDVYKLSEQNQELTAALEKLYGQLKNTEETHELEAIQRDYEEFQQPDLDGDDRISRTEFNAYVKNYLANYPGMEAADYPKFEDFDHDGDGFVSFKEYAKQMAVQTQNAERKQAITEDAERKKKLAAQQALKSLYK
jgi:EF hand